MDEYLAIGYEIGSEASSRLFYFLEFMEHEGGIEMIRFWIAASNIRRVYSQWKVPNSLDTSEPIQREIQKIYRAYSASTFYGLNDVLKAIDVFGLTQLPEHLLEACLAIFKCQGIVFDELQISFHQFLDSDHYFKLASELEKKGEASSENVSSSNPHLKGPEGEFSLENSIILSQLELELEHESLRLTGSKSNKDTEAWEASDLLLFNAVEDVLDVDALDGDILFDDNQKEGTLLSGLESQSSDILYNSTKLQQIKEDLDRNQQQLDILNILLQNCSSPTNNLPAPAQIMQIHILEQSQALIRQEMNDLNSERIKYQTQEQKEAIVPVIITYLTFKGLCIVRITRATESIREQKRVTFYEILVHKESGPRRWVVKRRYNEFLWLHKKLKDKFPIVHELDLPGKNYSIFHSKAEKEQLKKERMAALEKYLQRLIDNPLVCQSDELRSFLSSVEYKRKKYSTVESINDVHNYNIKSGAQKFAKFFGTAKRKLHLSREELDNDKVSSSTGEILAQSPEDESTDEEDDGDWGCLNEDQTDQDNSISFGVLSDPLCGVLVELFDIKEQDLYLKKTASAMLLKQCFGGMMGLESEIADLLGNYMTEDFFCKILNRANIERLNATESVKKPPSKSEENFKSAFHENISRNEMKSKLFSVWPDAFTRFLGTEATQTGVGRIIDIFQSSVLNRHIIFTLLDSIIEVIFEE